MYLADIPVALDSPTSALAFLLHPPPEFSDPAAEGITGRVLWGLGCAGVLRDDPAVCRAIDFLRGQQCDNGAWWGRWMRRPLDAHHARCAHSPVGHSSGGTRTRGFAGQLNINFLAQFDSDSASIDSSELKHRADLSGLGVSMIKRKKA